MTDLRHKQHRWATRDHPESPSRDSNRGISERTWTAIRNPQRHSHVSDPSMYITLAWSIQPLIDPVEVEAEIYAAIEARAFVNIFNAHDRVFLANIGHNQTRMVATVGGLPRLIGRGHGGSGRRRRLQLPQTFVLHMDTNRNPGWRSALFFAKFRAVPRACADRHKVDIVARRQRGREQRRVAGYAGTRLTFVIAVETDRQFIHLERINYS